MLSCTVVICPNLSRSNRMREEMVSRMAAYRTYVPWAFNLLAVLDAWRYVPLTVIRLVAAFARDEQHHQRCMDVLCVSRLSFHSSRTANSERAAGFRFSGRRPVIATAVTGATSSSSWPATGSVDHIRPLSLRSSPDSVTCRLVRP